MASDFSKLFDSLAAAYSPQMQAESRMQTDREIWQTKCYMLGVTAEQVRGYEQSAREYATTTVHPNHEIVEYAYSLALEALKRGESMPTSAEQAIQKEHQRQLVYLIG